MSAQDTVAKTTPLAMYAVARLMLDHKLPAPLSIDAPDFAHRHLTLWLSTADLDAWLEWTIVEDEHVRDSTSVGGYETVTYTGRISVAIGEVAVSIKVSRRVAGALLLVPGGAA